ncbi:hypothetical protein SAMN05216369_2815 [Marinobacter antarcticus]|uniref:Uncharacterized protein n=1 Tax=Marinobacter antarcticus TaxID=564117 RepID=A0A1M6UGS1_9GAMM|nr:hypothetical protein [Marinobacter antarcticus]SHK68268.1 hypothetical protein SAMN05216369_2815 [Marinobacter antarcticus]
MDYGESVQKVLLRKIRKAEQDLMQLKLDYCRFVFGLAQRARVVSGGVTYLVLSVDVDSMVSTEEGAFTRPAVEGVPADKPEQAETVQLGIDWVLEQRSKN